MLTLPLSATEGLPHHLDAPHRCQGRTGLRLHKGRELLALSVPPRSRPYAKPKNRLAAATRPASAAAASRPARERIGGVLDLGLYNGMWCRAIDPDVVHRPFAFVADLPGRELARRHLH